MTHSLHPIHVIGAGLAGSEAAWQIARRGVPVVVHEMRPVRATAVHKSSGFAELVFSNSFRSACNAAGTILYAQQIQIGRYQDNVRHWRKK